MTVPTDDTLPGAERSRSIGALIAVTLFAVVTISTATALVQSSKHTFHHKESWITSKTFLERGAIGGAMFRITRVPLARNVAHLGAWFGFHEIIWNEDLPVQSLDFEFRLDDTAWLAVLFNGVDHEFDTVRISRDPRLPPCAAHVDRRRLFSRRADATNGHAPTAGWHHGRLELRDTGYRLLVDGDVYDERTLDVSAVQRIGFKGGGASTWVDDVVITCADGTKRHESFANTRNLVRNTILITLAVALLHLGIARLTRRRGFGRRRAIYHLAAAVLCAAGSGAIFATDYFWYAARYPKNVLRTPLYRNTIVFEPDPVPEPVTDPESAPYRIMFVGSSQTWGSGATLESDMWTRVVERTLNATPGRTRRVECVNTGISGKRSFELLPRYREEWLAAAPDMTVINLSHNDKDTDRLRETLEQFARTNRELEIETVFVLEPNSHQPCTFNARYPPNVRRNHAMIRELATRLEVPHIDMQAKMDADCDRGFLWWDLVHLSSAGHAVFAENLLEELIALLP